MHYIITIHPYQIVIFFMRGWRVIFQKLMVAISCVDSTICTVEWWLAGWGACDNTRASLADQYSHYLDISSPSVSTSVWIVYSHFIAFFADKSLYVEQCDDINIETYPSLSLSLSFSLFIIQTSDNSNLLPANVWVYLYHNLTPPTDKLEIHKLVLSLSRHSN